MTDDTAQLSILIARNFTQAHMRRTDEFKLSCLVAAHLATGYQFQVFIALETHQIVKCKAPDRLITLRPAAKIETGK